MLFITVGKDGLPVVPGPGNVFNRAGRLFHVVDLWAIKCKNSLADWYLYSWVLTCKYVQLIWTATEGDGCSDDSQISRSGCASQAKVALNPLSDYIRRIHMNVSKVVEAYKAPTYQLKLQQHRTTRSWLTAIHRFGSAHFRGPLHPDVSQSCVARTVPILERSYASRRHVSILFLIADVLLRFQTRRLVSET